MGTLLQVAGGAALALPLVLIYADFTRERPFDKPPPPFKEFTSASKRTINRQKERQKLTSDYVKKGDHQQPNEETQSQKEKPKDSKSSNITIKRKEDQKSTLHLSQDCDAECQNFRTLLGKWPQMKVKGAIYYLIKMSAFNVHRLTLSLGALERFVLRRFQYPVIVFHEADFAPPKYRIRSSIQSPIFFQEINFEVPEFLEKPIPKKIIGCQRSISYRHMCRFQSKLVYEQPITQGLDFMWRLDDDSYLLAPIPFDIFQFMENHDLDYGYLSIGSEIESCVVGLWEAVEHYTKMHGVSTKFYRKWKYPMYYFNNFEISRRSIWTSHEYRSYIDYIDHKGGIYFHRWGDAPIKSLGVTLCVPETRTFCFRDMIQYHHSIYNLPPGFPHHNISEMR